MHRGMDYRGDPMTERAQLFGRPKSLVGILTTPSPDGVSDTLPGVIVLNAGILHRVGPNRIHVKIARRLADAGFYTLRFDMSGIGDSGVRTDTISFEKRAIQETREAMDCLGMKAGVDMYILLGICSGADIAFEVARVDERVTGVYLINGSLLPGDVLREIYADASARISERYYRGHLLNLGSWRQLLTGKSDMGSIRRFIGGKLRRRSGGGIPSGPEVDYGDLWNPLRDRGVDVALVFSEGSVALDVFRLAMRSKLDTMIENGKLSVDVMKDTDHVFTLLWSQERLIDMIYRWASDRGRNWTAGGRQDPVS